MRGKVRTSLKPQYVDKLPTVHKGVVRDLLRKVAERMTAGRGGRAAGAAGGHRPAPGRAVRRGAAEGGHRRHHHEGRDIYFFDEPSSYLDIYQRIKVARMIQSLGGREAGGRHRARPGHPGFPGRQRLPGLRFRGRVRYLRPPSAGAHRHQHLPGWLHAGGEHPIPGHPDTVRVPSAAGRQLAAVPLLEYGRMECDYQTVQAEGGAGHHQDRRVRRSGRPERHRQDHLRQGAGRRSGTDRGQVDTQRQGPLQAAVHHPRFRRHGPGAVHGHQPRTSSNQASSRARSPIR